MLRRPLSLVSSSRATTSLALVEPSAGSAWCFAARKPLFLRRGAPRHWARLGFRRSRRGASPPASPCSFIVEHHALDFLQSDNSGNPGRVPGIPLSPKNEKCRRRCCSRSTSPTFPLFPYQLVETVLSHTLEGQSPPYLILSYLILSYLIFALLCFALLCFALLCFALLC